MMKLVLIGLLLAHSAYGIHKKQTIGRGICLDVINHVRANYAKEHGIANMNELAYDRELEEKVENLLQNYDGCPQPSMISQNRFDTFLDMENGKKSDLIKFISGSGSSMMACVQSVCSKSGKPVFSIITDVNNTPAIKGSPGAKCPSNRIAGYKGLCAQKTGRKGYARKIGPFGVVGRAIEGWFD